MARDNPASAAYWAALASPALKATEISVKVEFTMATPTMVSSTTRTSTAARAEPRSPNELPGAGIREPGSDDPIAFRDRALRVSAFPRFRASASSRISVAAGPGERDHERTCRRCGKGGGQVLNHRPVVLDGRAPGATGFCQGDAAVGQQEAAQRERNRVRAVLEIEAQVANALQITAAVRVVRPREGVDDTRDRGAGPPCGRA